MASKVAQGVTGNIQGGATPGVGGETQGGSAYSNANNPFASGGGLGGATQGNGAAYSNQANPMTNTAGGSQNTGASASNATSSQYTPTTFGLGGATQGVAMSREGEANAPQTQATQQPGGTVQPTQQTSTANPDFQKTADMKFADYTQKMSPFNEAAMRVQQQKLAESGMSGVGAAAMGDRLAALQNTQTAQKAGEFNMQAQQQQAQLDSQKAVMQFSADLEMDAQAADNALGLLKKTASDDALFQQTLTQLAAQYPDNALIKTLMSNPEAAKVWQNDLKSGLFEQRTKNAGAVLSSITDFADANQVNGNFNAWNQAKTGGSLAGVAEIPDVWQDAALVERFQKATGNLFDASNEYDRKELSQFKRYVDQVNVMAAGELRDQLVLDLQTGGIDVNDPATLQKVEKAAGFLSQSLDDPIKLGNLVASFDGDTTNGSFSHLFTDWEGNSYNGTRQPDEYDVAMDKMWEDYVRTTTAKGQKPLPRMEWHRTVGGPAAYDTVLSQGKDLGELQASAWQKYAPQAQSQITPQDASQILVTEGANRESVLKSIGEIGKSPTAVLNMISDPTKQEQLERNGIFTQDISEIHTHNTSKVPGLEPGMIVVHNGKPYVFYGIFYQPGNGIGETRRSHLQGQPINPDGTLGALVEFSKKSD